MEKRNARERRCTGVAVKRAGTTLRRILAARLPDGTGWGRKEVPMWQRSEVERLTGLSRHAIQDLCNQNTTRDGLGFWVPAVSKPGYARYDEGDLLAFYLVKQLTKAGFTLAEVEPVVFGMLEDDATFAQALQSKEERLAEQQEAVGAKLAALAHLEDAVPVVPEQRLYAIMGEMLEEHAQEALRITAESAQPTEEEHALAAEQLRAFANMLLAVIQGEYPRFWRRSASSNVVGANHATRFQQLMAHLNSLMKREAPESGVAQSFVAEMVQEFLGTSDSSDAECRKKGSVRLQTMTVEALAVFCAMPENGVPIELVFGNGSFAYLARAMRAWANTWATER